MINTIIHHQTRVVELYISPLLGKTQRCISHISLYSLDRFLSPFHISFVFVICTNLGSGFLLQFLIIWRMALGCMVTISPWVHFGTHLQLFKLLESANERKHEVDNNLREN
jgi:hypothetical protein